MSGKVVVWSVLVATALIALAWIAVARRAMTVGDGRTAVGSSLMLPELQDVLLADPQAIDRIEIERHGGRALLERTPEGWIAAERAGYPLDEARVDGIVKALLTLERVEALTADPARHAALGLAWPDESGQAALVRLYAKGALVTEVVTGRTKFSPPTVYARRAGDPQTWRCTGELLPEADPVRYMNTVLSDLDGAAIGGIEWGPAHLERDEAGAWRVDGDVPEAKKPELARILPELFSRLEFDDVRPLGAARLEAVETVRAFVGDRTITLELLPLESSIGEDGSAADGHRWLRLVVGDPEPGLSAQAPPQEVVATLEAIRERSAGREFRLPAWRARRLGTLMSPEA